MHVGFIGSYMDFIPEHRDEFYRLGGIDLYKEILQTHYDNPKRVEGILDAYSTFCGEPNQKRCMEHGMVELMVQVMEDHKHSGRARQECMQCLRPLLLYSDAARGMALQIGLAKQLAGMLHDNKRKIPELALASTGVQLMLSDDHNETRLKAIADAGVLRELLTMIELDESSMLSKFECDRGYMSDEMFEQHYSHYRDGFLALVKLAEGSATNQKQMMQAGLPKIVFTILKRKQYNNEVIMAGCTLLKILAAGSSTQRTTVIATEAQDLCGPI